jgi:hypothetical protein
VEDVDRGGDTVARGLRRRRRRRLLVMVVEPVIGEKVET